MRTLWVGEMTNGLIAGKGNVGSLLAGQAGRLGKYHPRVPQKARSQEEEWDLADSGGS